MAILCRLCTPEEAQESCRFVVVLSRHAGGWIFSRHRARDTWETQGGHVEPGETLEEAARRELYEEAGGIPASLVRLGGYWAGNDADTGAYGMFFLAELARLDPLPDSEMAEARWFSGLPERLTYPDITPVLFARAVACLAERGA